MSPMPAGLSARVLTHAQHTLTILRDAFGPRLWYAETGFLACIARVLSQRRLALAAPTLAGSQWLAPMCRGGAPRARDACVSLTLTWP